ncbi:DUF3488 and transglutaminase-like domain-containing protein [Bacillus sp. JCM 19041]|uniref:transglutaminase family protein n=1 Tax=Bacillus sp. JCM 19041 TaxID=1460637 RepID=UPI0006D1F4C3
MHKRKRIFRDFLLYMFGFLLLLEWLYPVPYMTYTDEKWLFIITAGLFFFITFIRLPLFISLFLRFAIVIGALYWLFPETVIGENWLSMFMDDLFYNVILMASGNLVGITDLHRTLLFLLLLSIMSYLLYYWIVHARRILLFLLISIIYISTIDTFTEYSGSWAIVRIFIIGLFLLMVLHLLKKGEHGGAKVVYSLSALARAFALVAVFIFAAASIGYAMPKPEPQWPDPLPYIQSFFGYSTEGRGTNQRIGYSDDDRYLGGGFIQDDTPVFTAEVEEGQYWKGETKDLYTGVGWELSLSDNRNERSVEPPIVDANERSVETVEIEERQASVQFYNEGEQQFKHLFYPGELTTQVVSDALNEDVHQIQIDPLSDMATLVNGDFPPNLYELTFYDRTFMVEGLKAIGRPVYSEEELESYLQLPNDLPDRVGELAEEVTSNAEDQYEMVVAIEQFLTGPDFDYETEDVPVPEPGQDYVDQFLFETMRGYCDNFSTAMAIMLRSLDIPTKWVKGFTEGSNEGQSSEREGFNEYLVSNNNAHSWVEVYFPDVGWVPFEPTPSFSGFDFQQPEIDVDAPGDEFEAEEPESPEVDLPETPEMEEETEESSENVIEENNNTGRYSYCLSL